MQKRNEKRNEKRKCDLIPDNFETIEEFWNFWDTHSLSDYEDNLKEVNLKFNLKRRYYYIPVVPEIIKKIKQFSEKEGISIETITNLWLQEKLQEKSIERR